MKLERKDWINEYMSGSLKDCWNYFGAHPAETGEGPGFEFAVWVPGAESVSVTGSFCGWDTDRYPMTPEEGGVWRTFVPGAAEGDIYKYFIRTQSGETFFKADPYAFYAEQPPETASRIFDIEKYKWGDWSFLGRRKRWGHMNRPLNIYEVHMGSWKRHEDGSYYTYKELTEELIPYVCEMGYTHIELMPMMEHPFDGSWGYQITGYYAATSRYGSPDEFMSFIDSCHKAGIGVILDWVPGHFCRDAHGLYQFNGQKLYEDADHPQWGTSKFDFKRGEVRSFLLSNALFWIEKYHADGIRIDGVTSMLYLNFGIDDPAQKRFNKNGTEEDLDAADFIKQLNSTMGMLHPDIMMIAEESTAWPLVTYPPSDGGLGFHYKWDMGWMHDTLNYMKTDFPYRPGNHELLTFSIMYAFNENFILALSHDEVVHGKCSLIERMPGDYWRQFAGMRVLMLYQMCHSGGKHNFMGNEIAQFIEWRYYEGIEWFLLQYDKHREYHHFVSVLNDLYKKQKALWQRGYSYDGYEWLSADDREQSTIIFARHGNDPADALTVILNFVPEVVDDFRIGVPSDGYYEEIINTDDVSFGGSGRVNPGRIKAEKVPFHGKEYSIVVKTPPIGGAVYRKCAAKKTAGRKKNK